jgi:3-dehydroquinate synthase
VVGDITGFAASILLRGVPFVQIPTTLLAMVDSSVGGKTGINTTQGKNLIGSFYQPSLVIMDTRLLTTLPRREQQAGFAEIVKYGCIMDAAFFARLEESGIDSLTESIATSCRLKAEIVAQDEKETSDIRALLNFGHSFGHALEAECGYDGTLLHGEAVAIGMVMAATLSEQRGYCPQGIAARIETLLRKQGLHTRPTAVRSEWNLEALIQRMRSDKKNIHQRFKLILLREIGQAFVTTEITESELTRCWEEFLK